jgi:pimeloyl-ACP methyl ester carboxylesterase
MTQAGEQILTRVVSRDGTPIGYFSSGEGPPLVLVHGLLGDHSRWQALRPYLEPHFTIHAMDRRGRGASGDAAEYAFEREFEDVAAVVNAVAGESGAAVNIFGSSGGALFSLGAALQTDKIHRMALFEPPLRYVTQLLPGALLERLDALLAQGDHEGVLVASYRAIVGLSDEQIEHLRAQPSWQGRIAAAHTVPRELRSASNYSFSWEQVKNIRVPSLVLVGSETPHAYRRSAEDMVYLLLDSELIILAGQGHGAEMFAPQLVAEPLVAFLNG